MGGGKELTIPQYYAAGSLAAIPISIVEAPVDLFKIKLQAQVSHAICDVCPIPGLECNAMTTRSMSDMKHALLEAGTTCDSAAIPSRGTCCLLWE